MMTGRLRVKTSPWSWSVDVASQQVSILSLLFMCSYLVAKTHVPNRINKTRVLGNISNNNYQFLTAIKILIWSVLMLTVNEMR